MKLTHLKYSEYPQAWHLNEFSLKEINLIVGKNASGKTRTLSVIDRLANLVSGYSTSPKLPFDSGYYDLCFDKDGKTVKYILGYDKAKVYQEELAVGEEKLLERGKGGKGKIYYVKEGRKIEFQVPDNELAAVARRDSLQHPFFEDLYKWGKNTLYYRFATYLGKTALFTNQNKDNVNLKATEQVVGILKKGLKKYGDKFEKIIIEEMEMIGYKLNRIGVEPVENITVKDVRQEGIFLQEADLKHKIYQQDISDGMFRAFSLIVQLNFAQSESVPACILIDDIGEGLDFERSSKLIKLLVNKIKNTPVQLIMATNDRFVMNNVPLKYWAIIQRQGEKCKIFNYENSKEAYEQFEFTGLNNFDFFSSNFFLTK